MDNEIAESSSLPGHFPAKVEGGSVVRLMLCLPASGTDASATRTVGKASVVGCGSAPKAPIFTLHNTKLNAGLCAVTNASFLPEFSRTSYPFVFKSFDDLPKTLGDIQKGDVVAWDYSLFELDCDDPKVNGSSASLQHGDQGRLRLNVSSMRTVRVIMES